MHLTCHQRDRPIWREDIAAFVPGSDLPPGMTVAGAANGTGVSPALVWTMAIGLAVAAGSAAGCIGADSALCTGMEAGLFNGGVVAFSANADSAVVGSGAVT